MTQELTALKPFVFPAPKPEPIEPYDASSKLDPDPLKDAFRKAASYPCQDCAGEIPAYYCTACKTEHDKRWKADVERDRAKQRKWYKQRKLRRQARETPDTCAICGNAFKKRADTKWCSGTCRQKAYRRRKKAGTDYQQPSEKQLIRIRERERQARIKLKWKTIAWLPAGSTVVVNAKGQGFPRGTKLKVGFRAGWSRRVRLDRKGKSYWFDRYEVDAYDIVPAVSARNSETA